jgi:hypothetical protein
LVGGANIGVQSTPGRVDVDERADPLLIDIAVVSAPRKAGSLLRGSVVIRASPLKETCEGPSDAHHDADDPSCDGDGRDGVQGEVDRYTRHRPEQLDWIRREREGDLGEKPAIGVGLWVDPRDLPPDLASTSPLSVAFFFHRICVAWFQASAPAWLISASPTVCLFTLTALA